MKKQLFVLFALLSFALPVSASNMSDDFKSHYTGSNLAAYNRDISNLIGMADFHTAKGTTFPGFDVGATLTAVKTSSANFSDKNYFYAPFITAETKLPFFGVSVAARGTSFDDFKSIGGGLKWTQKLAIFNLAGAMFYDHFSTDYYRGNHYSASGMASVDVLFITPFVGIGYDNSKLTVKSLDSYSGDNTTNGTFRATAGVNLHPLPFVYLFGAYTYTKDNHGFQGGLGISF